MAETELGKALESLIDAGEKVMQAIEAARDAVKVWENTHNPVPPDDQPTAMAPGA